MTQRKNFHFGRDIAHQLFVVDVNFTWLGVTYQTLICIIGPGNFTKAENFQLTLEAQCKINFIQNRGFINLLLLPCSSINFFIIISKIFHLVVSAIQIIFMLLSLALFIYRNNRERNENRRSQRTN